MRRETVNKIRYVLEEWLPPVLRDSAFMRVLFRRHWGTFIDDLEQFRTDITKLSAADYRKIYERMPRIHDGTDNSLACLQAIARSVVPQSVCDIGCGTGYLLGFLRKAILAKDLRLTGVDFLIEAHTAARHPDIEFREAPIERLPFDDGQFDTVICTHVLEHILDIQQAVSELRRICRKRLVIVVPLEREYLFTFNPHLHFFPYPHSFFRHIIPVPSEHKFQVIGRDLLYIEDMSA